MALLNVKPSLNPIELIVYLFSLVTKEFVKLLLSKLRYPSAIVLLVTEY
jgi:hypothetical protein